VEFAKSHDMNKVLLRILEGLSNQDLARSPVDG
jgi:hypothetical protein